MKIGDLVKFHDRLERDPKSHLKDGPRAGDVFLVVERMDDPGDRPSTSKFVQWRITNMETGKTYVQVARDLHVLPDIIEHEIEVMVLALAE
jgi:hypothetical protein